MRAVANGAACGEFFNVDDVGLYAHYRFQRKRGTCHLLRRIIAIQNNSRTHRTEISLGKIHNGRAVGQTSEVQLCSFRFDFRAEIIELFQLFQSIGFICIIRGGKLRKSARDIYVRKLVYSFDFRHTVLVSYKSDPPHAGFQGDEDIHMFSGFYSPFGKHTGIWVRTDYRGQVVSDDLVVVSIRR